jgi:hypothetical protein
MAMIVVGIEAQSRLRNGPFFFRWIELTGMKNEWRLAILKVKKSRMLGFSGLMILGGNWGAFWTDSREL